VYVITGPVIDRPYDSEKEKRLIRAAKKKKLEDLEGESLLGTAGLFPFLFKGLVSYVF
jgi:hypothetical protein